MVAKQTAENNIFNGTKRENSITDLSSIILKYFADSNLLSYNVQKKMTKRFLISPMRKLVGKWFNVVDCKRMRKRQNIKEVCAHRVNVAWFRFLQKFL